MNIGNDATGFILTDVGVAAESTQTENVGEGMFPCFLFESEFAADQHYALNSSYMLILMV